MKLDSSWSLEGLPACLFFIRACGGTEADIGCIERQEHMWNWSNFFFLSEAPNRDNRHSLPVLAVSQ